MELINYVLKNLGYVILFLNVILYFYFYFKGQKSKAVKYIVIYLTLTFCVSMGSELITEIQGILNIKKDNLFLSHFYFIFQFIFLSLFYSQLFTKEQIKYQKIISIIVFSVLLIQYVISPNLFLKFNLLEIFITSSPLVLYSIFHLYNSLSKSGKFMFINAGVLIYLSISTLFFILGNLLTSIDRSLTENVWFLNQVFYIGYLLLILIEWKKSLWKTKD